VAERRPLTEGLKPVERAAEEAFVFSTKPKPQVPAPTQVTPAPEARAVSEQRGGEERAATTIGRSPLTVRLRADYADSLKRASLERQLKKLTPNTLQDILEEALEPWLRSNGYLN